MREYLWRAGMVLMLVSLGIHWPTVLADTKKADLRFSHKTHYAQGMTCEQCHFEEPEKVPGLPEGWQPLRPSRIVTPGSGEVKGPHGERGSFGRPPEKSCLQCHFKERNKRECSLCHLERNGPTHRVRRRIRFGARFPHDKHKKHDCLECHQKVPGWDDLNGVMQDTSMKGCLECHNGVKAKKTCVLCHDPTPRPRDHVRNFERKHGIAYRADPQNCRMCHEDSSCVACHSRKPKNHTLAWISRRHGFAARNNPDRCRACHSDPYVCLRCHAEIP